MRVFLIRCSKVLREFFLKIDELTFNIIWTCITYIRDIRGKKKIVPGSGMGFVIAVHLMSSSARHTAS